jgi:hypothetical protein
MDLHDLERDMVNRTTVRIALLEKVAEAAKVVADWHLCGATLDPSKINTLRTALAALEQNEEKK